MSDESPYLILHKVRGEPAFDIAVREMIAGAETWTVASSGHTAHPYRTWPLEDLMDVSDINNYGHHDRPIDYADRPIPGDWPDHYSCNNKLRGAKPLKPSPDLSDILEFIKDLK